MSRNGISREALEMMSKDFHSDRANEVAATAAVNNGIIEASADYEAGRRLPMNFSVDLKTGKITNQKASGRCWIFSALNTFRYEIMKKFDLDNFELSQNYLFFYDKLEKSNYFLESVIKTVDEPIDGRLYSFLNLAPLGDGGQWDMLYNLVKKYGVVPKEAYPDSEASVASRFFDMYMTTKLREDAKDLRQMVKAGASEDEVHAAKASMLNDLYRMLTISLGEPPRKFDLNLRSRDGILYREFGITPQDFFAKYVGLDLDDYVSMINGPTKDKPFNHMYTVKFLGNVAEGRPVTYLNLEMDKIKAAAIRQLQDGHPVWFGSDCRKFVFRRDGIFDRDTVAVEKLFNVKLNFTKEEYLDYGDSAMNHAMVILGVNLDENGRPDRWHIENSWGDDPGQAGYFVASDSWFDSFVYQVVVNKKYMDPESVALLSGELHELEPWDPFGTLAD